MKHLLQSDLTKLLILLILTTVCAAAVTPLLYNAGMMTAEIAESHPTHPTISWLAQKCSNADFPRYFNYALILCALALAGPFIMWMRLGNQQHHAEKGAPSWPWRITLPSRCSAHDPGQPLQRNPHSWLHASTGFLLACSLPTLMIWLLLLIGWLTVNNETNWTAAPLDTLATSIATSIATSGIEELFFRGILLGILLRAMKPWLAILSTSFFYAGIHFLLPPIGVTVAHPDNLDAGFHMITLIGQRFMEPQTFAPSFISLFAIGIILAYARYRTASLWLPIGLHAGWVFIHEISKITTHLNNQSFELLNVFVGPDRISGLIPLSLIVSTGLLVHVFTQLSSEKQKTAN